MIIQKDKTKLDFAQHLHDGVFSTNGTTFRATIQNNNFTTWLGLTSHPVTNFVLPSINTGKGQLNQEIQSLQFTTNNNTSNIITLEDETYDAFPLSNVPNRTFAHTSIQRNQYMLVVNHQDSNVILAEPLKRRTAGEITRGWTIINKKSHVMEYNHQRM